ncbi:MAG TPA: DUF1569 domain-containing protein [Chitinophagales bacterium]|nr:DUF1569 domain-containing protein [Chitinophagales bacterium]
MESLWNKNNQALLISRIEQLKDNSPRKWGKMDVAQMLEHINIAYKNSIDEVQVNKNPLSVIISLPPVKKLMIYGMPFLKNLPTAKEYIVKDSQDFEKNKEDFLKTFHKITQKGSDQTFVSHPIFGELSYEDWGALLSKHLDHHLKQFGV